MSRSQSSALILGEPNDLCKLLFVVNHWSEYGDDWSSDPDVSKRMITRKVNQEFDCTGEKAIDVCFDIAIDYGFICPQIDEERQTVRYESGHDLDRSHDWFCFDCDVLVDKTSDQFIKCMDCFRVFHRNCLKIPINPKKDDKKCDDKSKEDKTTQQYKCLYCLRVEEWEPDGHIGHQTVDQPTVNKLIGYLFRFLENKMKAKLDKLVINYDLENSLYIYKQMDLKMIKENTLKNEYKSVAKFEDDFFLFMHNLHIVSDDFGSISEIFADLRLLLMKELAELRLCVNCYDLHNDKELQSRDKDWFIRPCDPPHKLVFVKIGGHPFYPAKVIERKGDKCIVRFFDNKKNKMEIKRSKSKVRPIHDQEIRQKVANNKNLLNVWQLLQRHEELLAQKTGGKPAPTAPDDVSMVDASIENVVRKGRPKGRKNKPRVKKNSESSDLLTDISDNSRSGSIVSQLSSITATTTTTSVTQPLPMTTPMKDIETDLTVQSDMKNKRRSGRLSAMSHKEFSETNGKTKPNKVLTQNDVDLDTEMSDCTQVLKPSASGSSQMAANHSNAQTVGPDGQSTSQSSRSLLNSFNEIKLYNKTSAEDDYDEDGHKNICEECRAGGDLLLCDYCPRVYHKVCVDGLQEVPDVWMCPYCVNNQKPDKEAPKVLAKPKTNVTDKKGKALAKSLQDNMDLCELCVQSGQLLLCDTCPRAYHLKCLALDSLPTGLWSCPHCQQSGHQNSNHTSNQSSVSTSQPIVNGNSRPMESTRSKTVDKPIDEEFGPMFAEYADNFKRKFDELNAIKDLNDLRDKLILTNYYNDQQIQELKSQVIKARQETDDAKSANWCAVCKQIATFYCCLRYYCGQECQRADWIRGHSNECLLYKK